MQPRKIFGKIKPNATVPGMDDKQQPSENAGMVILKDFPLYGLVSYCHEVLKKPQNLKSLIFPYMNF